MEELKINDNSKKWIILCNPKSIKDIIGHKYATNKIIEWLNNYNCNSKKKHTSCMIVTGNHGIGKTCVILTILKSLKYDIKTINFNKIVHSKNP